MKKVLFMVTKSENGGAQKWSKEQIEICSEDFNCYLATDENGWLSQNVKVKNKYLSTLIKKRLSLRYLLDLNKFIKENNIDLIIASSANAGIYSRLIKILNRSVKIIYVSHGWSSIYNGGKLAFLYTFIEKQLSKISDSILCISKQDYQNAQDIIGIEKNKLKWITNKIFSLNKNKDFKETKKIKLLSVARLTSPKRIDLIINATKNIDNLELYIVGDGILRNSLEAIKHKNVFFLGEIDAFDDFAAYDIFTLISESEGLPLSALEAMDAEMPLILSDVGGCSELIENNGVLTNNNVDEIKKAIELCIVNKTTYSKQSKDNFNKKFDLELNKSIYLEYYNKILN